MGERTAGEEQQPDKEEEKGKKKRIRGKKVNPVIESVLPSINLCPLEG